MNSREREFRDHGFVVVRSEALALLIEVAAEAFKSAFLPLFTGDTQRNRTIIKRFADSYEVARIFSSSELEAVCRTFGINRPVFCGPIASHYTSTNETGNAFGLPYHQDWPAMASSDNSLVMWTSVTECGPTTHGLEVAPGSHRHGLLPGSIQEHGYILDRQDFPDQHVIKTSVGDLVLMSPFLPHRTFVNPKFKEWKLSLSRRVDDLADPAWARRGYRNAFSITVDRDMYRLDCDHP